MRAGEKGNLTTYVMNVHCFRTSGRINLKITTSVAGEIDPKLWIRFLFELVSLTGHRKVRVSFLQYIYIPTRYTI